MLGPGSPPWEAPESRLRIWSLDLHPARLFDFRLCNSPCHVISDAIHLWLLVQDWDALVLASHRSCYAGSTFGHELWTWDLLRWRLDDDPRVLMVAEVRCLAVSSPMLWSCRPYRRTDPPSPKPRQTAPAASSSLVHAMRRISRIMFKEKCRTHHDINDKLEWQTEAISPLLDLVEVSPKC